MIYFDNSATSPVDEEVLEAMLPYLKEEYGNPSSKYYCKAVNARNAVEEARIQVAKLMGANPEEIIFTAGATESTNFVIKGYMDYRRYYGDGKNHIITSVAEHKATLNTCKYLNGDLYSNNDPTVTLFGGKKSVDRGYEASFIDITEIGEILATTVENAIKNNTAMVSVIYVNRDTVTTEAGKELNLFPFSRRAIVYLYNNLLQENYRTPRYLLRDVVERTVRDALWNFDNFPGFKIVNTNINSSLRDAIQKTGVSNEQFERMYLFMCVWGDATTNTYQEGERTFISGLSTNVYEDMGFPLISGKKITGKLVPTKPVNQFSGQSGTTMTVVKTSAQIAAEQKLQAERAQLNESLQAIENWIAGGTINVGATTGNVVLISKAREDMCNYLYSAIDWQAEGVSMDNIDKIKKVTGWK